MGCGAAVMRLILFITNLIVFIAGLVFTAVGALIFVRYAELKVLFTSNILFFATGVLAIGILLILLGVTGVCGACLRGTPVCLYIHCFLIIVLVLVEIGGVVAMLYYATEDDFSKTVNKTVSDTYNAYGANTTDKTDTQYFINEGVDLAQELLSCCGKNNYTDWKNSSAALTWVKSLEKGAYYPDSCCKTNTKNCGMTTTDLTKFNQKGCMTKIENWMDEWFYYISGGLVFVVLFQFINLCFTCCLVKINRKH